MIFLWLSIFSSSLIYVLFKIRKQLGINLTAIIIINYLFATVFGLLVFGFNNTLTAIKHSNWSWLALLIGVFFVVMFYLIGISTQKAGIAISTIATRMSMIIPISFSVFIFDENLGIGKALKICIALIAVLLAIYQPINKAKKISFAILPLILFIGSGSVDTLVKTAQHLYVPSNEVTFFSTVLFATSFFASLLLPILTPRVRVNFNSKTILTGIVLGAANFGSLYFFMNALHHSGLDSSIVFGINNLAIVAISLTLGFLIFKEKLSTINKVGIILSLISIALLSF
ncbi:MAG TPA: DMT family transporter [Prolixibacteraceae bacterium]|nr:DMT family transporter [Prolixibacteraceae bacterium]